MFVRLFISSSFVHIITLNPLVIDLIGWITYFKDEALKIYNDYAFKVGFSVRYHKVRSRSPTQKLSMVIFVVERKVGKTIKTNHVRVYKC